jgi:GAF domain-containing protein/nitrogen-specific signal transduction histidine kinase/ActR/RegA family two-component response regulator
VPGIAPDTGRLFETLARLARAVSSTLDPDHVLRTIVRGVLELSPEVVARIWVVEGESVRLGAEAGTRATDRSDRQVFALGEGLAGMAALAAEPVFIADVSTDPRAVNRDWMRQEGFVSFLGLPLLADGQPVGVLSIFTRRHRQFSPEEIEVFRAFGDQAAIAIQNARLHAAVQTRARRLAALTRVNRLISETLDPDAILREIARAAAELMPTPLALFWRADPAGRRLELVATTDDAMTADFPFREVSLSQGIIGWIATHRRPANVPDVFGDPRFVALDWWRRHGLRSFYGLPVADGERLVAVLALNGREPFQVDADDERLLESFAAQAAVTLRNARLYAESERRRREAEALLSVAREAATTLDRTEAMRRLAREVARALGADMVGAYLLTPDGDGLLPIAGYHVPETLRQSFRTHRIPLRGHRFLEEAWEHRTPVWTADAVADPRVDRPMVTRWPHRSLAFVPISVKGEVVGGFFALWWRAARPIHDEELRLVQGIADQAALALENARLYSEATGRRREAEELARLTRALTETLDPRTIADRIVQSVLALFGGQIAALRLLSEDGSLLSLAVAGPAADVLPEGHVVPRGVGLVGRVVREGRALTSRDVLEDPTVALTPEWRRRLGRIGPQAVAAAPLRINGTLVGVLSLADRGGRVFSDAELTLLQTFADHGAAALQNARLYAESERRRRATEAVLEAAQAMTSTLDLPRVLEAVARRTAQALAADRCSIWLFSDGVMVPLMSQFADGHADPELWKRFKALPRRPPDEIGVYREAIRTRRPVAVEDTRRADVPAEWREIFSIGSALVVPVFHQDRLVGVMAVDRRVASAWSGEHQELAQAIAAQTGLAVENARLFAEHRESAEIATALLRLSQSLEGVHRLSAVLHRVVRFTCDALKLERCAVFLVDTETRHLVPIAAAGASNEARRAVAAAGHLPVPPGLAAALSGSDPLVIEEARTRLGLPDGLADRLALGSVLVIPLAVGGRPVALVAADTPGQERGFDRRQLALARGIVAHAAAALERAMLYREMERRRREAEVLAELARTVNGSLDLDTVLQQVTRAARELCRSDAALISLREPEGEAAVHRYWVGYTLDATQRVEPGRGAGGLVLATGRPFRTENYVADPRITRDYVERIRSLGIVAEMVVPIRIGDRVEGLIYVDNRSSRPFTDRDEAVLVRLADHAAIAIRNSRLYAAEQTARARLAESGRFLQSTLDALGEHIAVLDEGGTIIAVNEAWRRFAAANGFAAPGAGLGLNYLAVCEAAGPDAEPAQEVAAALREVIAGRREEAVFEYPCHAPTERRWFILRARRFPGPGPVRLVVSHADITSRRLAEEALREREEQARQLQKMEAIGRLAGGIAHDFNNLLTVISGRSQLALRRLRAEDPVRRDVALVHQTAERAAALTRQLLAFSRKQVLQPRTLDLAAVVRDLVPMLERLLGEDVELVVRSAAGPVPVKADPSHLEQVIVNLAVNARDAMPRGGRLTMTIDRAELDAAFCERHGGGRPGPHALLAVADTGVGMSEEVRSRVFEPFFTTKPAGRGTGLGLSTVYGIVRQHGGAITVESQVGRGSTFRVYLPITDERAETGSADEPAPSVRGAETILLVEDEGDVRALARDLLREQGYTVLEAATSTEAIEIGQRHRDPIHLLVTDVVMPRMSGRELAERLLALRPDLRVLYISGYPDDVLAPHDVDRAERVLLPKPFTSETLARAVRRVLDAEPEPTAG